MNFDFFDSHGNVQTSSVANAFNSEASNEVPSVTTFGDATMQHSSANHSPASNHVFSWNSPNSFFPVPLAHTLSRSVDDLDHGVGHHTAAHHHQRSLSLRDVAPPTAADGISMDSLTSLPFPSVKMEEDHDISFVSNYNENAPSPITEDRSSPSSSAVSSSLFDHGSPRNDKKRRLASPSESLESNHSIKSAKSTSMARSNTASGNGKKANGGRRSRANTINGKGNTPTTGLGLSASSLIENMTVSAPVQMGQPLLDGNQQQAQQQQQQIDMPNHQFNPATQLTSSAESQEEAQDRSNSPHACRADSVAPKSGNKRPPPSASQVTESGQPFPVIDTSAKHSSLFVPPDTSGLTKREARLVKNRAAAFLSRQRKREQFEELEVKCKNLCRLVWRFWEIVAGPNHDIPFTEKYSQTRILPILLQEEVIEVKEVLEMVVALKGGSVAPTEDGQLQGAVAAGINSANGRIIPDAAGTTSSQMRQAPPPSQQPPNAGSSGVDHNELSRLRAALEESKKRESALQAELVQERSMRMNESYHNSSTKPFKGGKQDEALSLTISPKYEEEEEEESARGRSGAEDASRRRGGGRSSGRSGPRTSERLQRQQSQLALTSASTTANGGQRKAAGAALMMVLFSFALFGLPSGQMSRVGGITRAGSTEE